MSLETMNLEFYVEQPLWQRLEDTSTSKLQDFVSHDLEPMDLDRRLNEEDSIRKYICDRPTSSDFLSGSAAIEVWPESTAMFDEVPSEHPTALANTSRGSAEPYSPVPFLETLSISESSMQTQVRHSIPAVPSIVSQSHQQQFLQEASPSLLESVTQSTHDMPQENDFEGLSGPQDERVVQAQFWSQPRQKLIYGNSPHFKSRSAVQGNVFKSQNGMSTSGYELQHFTRTTPGTEVYLDESSEVMNTSSEIDDHLASQQRVICNTANYEEQACNTQLLKSYNLEGFHYSEVWISDPRFCPCCDKAYANSAYLIEHFKRYHKNKSQLSIRCPQCNLTVMNETNLLRHIKNVHRRDKIVDICETCNAQFSSFSSARSHRRNVHGIQAAKSRQMSVKKKNVFFQCETCGSYAKEKGNMMRHVKIVHLQRRSFHCACGIAFKTKHNLACHVASKNCLRRKA